MPSWAPSPMTMMASGRVWQRALWRGANPGILLQMMLAPRATTEDSALWRGDSGSNSSHLQGRFGTFKLSAVVVKQPSPPCCFPHPPKFPPPKYINTNTYHKILNAMDYQKSYKREQWLILVRSRHSIHLFLLAVTQNMNSRSYFWVIFFVCVANVRHAVRQWEGPGSTDAIRELKRLIME